MDGTVSPQLEDKVNEIRGHLEKAKADGWSLNEADTERVIIFPLLTALGYGPLDIRQRGHDSVANNFPDYTLLPGTTQKWFLEVKRLDLSLQDGEAAQTVNYANNQGAEWAVLTNGRKWYIYNAHLPKPLTEKRVFQIDDLFGDASTLKTLAFLSRLSMLKEGLTQAWTLDRVQRIVKAQFETPNSAVRKRLRQIAAGETNGPVSDALVEQALHCLYNAVPANVAPTKRTLPPVPISPDGAGASLHTLAEIAANSLLGTGRKPVRLYFADGSSTETTAWADAAVSILIHIGKQYGLPSLPFSNRAKGKTYFLNTQAVHSTGVAMKAHREVHLNDTTLFMDTNRSTQEIVASMLILFSVLSVPVDIVKISIR